MVFAIKQIESWGNKNSSRVIKRDISMSLKRKGSSGRLSKINKTT